VAWELCIQVAVISTEGVVSNLLGLCPLGAEASFEYHLPPYEGFFFYGRFIRRSSISFEDGGKCGGGRQEIRFLIPCIIARVSGGAVRRGQLLMSWRSVLGLIAPGWLLQRRWCSVDSISLHSIGQLWLSRSSKSIARLWLYCQLWVILITFTCDDERKRREVFAKVWPVYHFKDIDVPALFLHDVVLECVCCFSEAESTV